MQRGEAVSAAGAECLVPVELAALESNSMAVVLLFESAPSLRAQLEWLLESAGHRVTDPESLDPDSANDVDVAVVDVTDSAGAGLAFAEAFRADPRNEHAALVTLTAVRLRCPEADAEIWMPFETGVLLNAVEVAVAKRRASRAL